MASIQASPSRSFSIVEGSINDLRIALDQGWITSVELIAKFLNRIAVYDRRGKLNAIPLLNLSVFEDAAASDERRASGLPIRSLEGIPFTVKDSYKVKGMTVASGSPAFCHLVANEDAFILQKLRDAGAILVGKTNMPPMAAGGMQRGCYGRAESPYNKAYLTAAFGSGSSNGSATSTAASFAAFGMAGETVSSGRSPASNNSLVAYTPSRGLISLRGSWPLYPTCDVAVPHARTMGDLLEILDVIMVKDQSTAGDFWRDQSFVTLPEPSDIRPSSFMSLTNVKSLQGRRIGVPKIYIGKSEASRYAIETHQSILDLWYESKKILEALGATVIEVDLPVIEKYDTVSSTFGALSSPASAMEGTGDNRTANDGITPEWTAMERRELVAYAWDDFLIQNADPTMPSLSNADSSLVFPSPPGSLPDRYTRLSAPISWATIVSLVSDRDGLPINSLPGISAALHSLENRRKDSFESWLLAEELDCIVFPANADVGPADTDVNVASADKAWKNGVMYSNGNRVLRHLGIPTVTVTMGEMRDIGMPVGLTFAGKAYDDVKLLEVAGTYEAASKLRKAPPGTTVLDSDLIESKVRIKGGNAPVVTVEVETKVVEEGKTLVKLTGTLKGAEELRVTVDGQGVDVSVQGGKWEVVNEVEVDGRPGKAEIDKPMVVLVAVGKNGRASAKLLLLD